MRAAETDVGAADGDGDAAASLGLDHDLVSVPAADQLDASVVDEVADGIVVGDRLELDMGLVRLCRLELDLPGRDLEVQPDGAGSGERLAAHQKGNLPAMK